ncbi:myosin-10-like [Pyrus x bretschneideri]|uniref:myosin-10-like n=1 Tax=Pyrus x bretschneideri TaxID=225117 RepID=UPI00202EE297|nr:myosin-10-like [Pyrus x bretschneideri]
MLSWSEDIGSAYSYLFEVVYPRAKLVVSEFDDRSPSQSPGCSSELLHKSSVEELTDKHSRALELHSAFEAPIAEVETKLQEAIETFSQRDLEANGFSTIVEQLQAAKRTIEDLMQQHSSQGQKLQSQISSLTDENNLLNEVHQNTKKELQLAISNLEEQLKEQKTLPTNDSKPLRKSSVEELTDKHSRALELHSAFKARIVEAETKLQEAIETFSQRDLEANGISIIVREVLLQREISELKEQLNEQRAREAALISEVQILKDEVAEKPLLQNSLKELQTKSARFEEERRKLAEANIKFKEDVSTCKYKQCDLEAKYSTAVAEKHKSVEQLQAAKRTIEDLTQQHSSQGQKLQSQISSLMDENRLLNEVHQNTKQELQQVISNLEEKLKEQKAGEAALKSEVKYLKAEAAEKPLLQNSLKELQTKLAHCEEESRKLVEANKKLKEDVSTYESKQSDLEAKYSTAIAKNDKSVEQLQAAKKTIEDLTQQHSSEGQKLQSQISSLMDENRLLNEVHQNTKKELQQVKNLKAEAAEKPLLQNSLKELQTKLARCEEDSRKLAKANKKLKEDVSTYKSKQRDLEAKYSSAIAEKDESVEKLQAAKRTIEDLMQQHSSQRQKLQSQISSLTDENNLLNEVHQNTKKELQLAISNLEEQLKEQKTGEAALKSEVENLKAEAAGKPLLQNSLKELQTKSAHFEEESRKLADANIKLKEDVSTYESKQSDLEAKYSTAVAENDESVEQLQAAKRTIEDLKEQHSSQGQKLQSQLHLFATDIFAYG